jgi:hypothetical protein
MDAGCGHCGRSPAQTITLELRGEALELNVCDRHMQEVLQGARPEARLHVLARPSIPTRPQGQGHRAPP